MKKAIVTGANGFIGRHLVEELILNGYLVYAIVRNSNCDNIRNTDAIIIDCDMDNIGKLKSIIGYQKDAIFFDLAWEGSSGEKRKDYKLQLKNAIRTVEALKSANEIGCKEFIIAGSVTQLLYRDYLRKDGIHPEPVTCYAVGKMTAEALVKCVCGELNINYCWCYIANFYGEDDPTNNFIKFLINTYSKQEIPTLTPATQLADFIHVSDVAKALVALGEKNQRNESVYIGFGMPKPLKYFINIVHDKIAPNIPSGIGLKKFEGISVDYNKIDYKKLERITGFKPSISFEKGIESMLLYKKE